MGGLRSLFTPPARDAGPVESLRWVRRMEIVSGIAALVGAALVWSNEWWNWLLLGSGVLGVSPWPGARAILRKAERRPEILVSDPERRRRRGRRALEIILAVHAVAFTVIGYLLLGWSGAALGFVLGVVGCASGMWTHLRMQR